MILKYAKLWLRKFIKYNHELNNKTLSYKLNRAVINLSHRVFKSRGTRGHSIRQKIRRQLQNFVVIELNKYNKNWTIKSPNYGYVKSPSFLGRLKKWFCKRMKEVNK